MSPNAYALIGLTAIVAALVGLLTFAVLRIGAAARDSRRYLRDGGTETALLSAALQEAVTKLKTQEREMWARAEASEWLSNEIFASLTAGLLVVGLKGDVRIVNPAGRRLLRLPDALPAGNYREMLTEGEPLAAVIDECLATRRPIVRRALRLSTEPSALHLGVTVSPLVDESKELHGAICLFTDLTTVIDLEEQVRLKDSLARVGELTAGIAHEFRNGLATIHGYSRLIDLDTLPVAYRPYVEGIRSETRSLEQVVTNFLNFAKPAQLTLGPVDLRAIAERVADELRAEATTRGGDIVVSGQFATVQGDDVLLRQAMSNLLRNGIEACVGAQVAPHVTIDSRIDDRQGTCRIAIDDNGPGVERAMRDDIFRPFFTTKATGTGLGLALVLKIVVTHNGRIAVGTSPRGGASFQVTLPLPAGDSVPVTNRNTSVT